MALQPDKRPFSSIQSSTVSMMEPKSKRQRTDENNTQDIPFSNERLNKLIKIVKRLRLHKYFDFISTLLKASNQTQIWNESKSQEHIQHIFNLATQETAQIYLKIVTLPTYSPRVCIRYDEAKDTLHFMHCAETNT
eukprot:323997_1